MNWVRGQNVTRLTQSSKFTDLHLANSDWLFCILDRNFNTMIRDGKNAVVQSPPYLEQIFPSFKFERVETFFF